jgi:hypothetical protein
MRGSRGF